MTSDEYAVYLMRIMQAKCDPSMTLTLQVELTVLRYIEAASNHGVMLDRAWFERRLAAAAPKTST
jgi:hypothetical protein